MTAPAPATAARPTPTASRSRPPAAPSINNRVLGGLLLVFGTGWLLKQTGVLDVPWTAVVSMVLVALGLAMIATSRTRGRIRTVPLIVLGLVLTAGLAVGSSNIDIKGGVGDRTFAPTALVDKQRYHLGIGDMTLDLRRANLADGLNTVTADVGLGHLLVLVPRGVDFRVEVATKLGNAVVLGRQLDIHGRAHDSSQTPGFDTASRRLRLVLKAGVGQIDVK